MFPRRILSMLLPAALLAAGCLQVEISIKMHQDGSATIDERVHLSRELLELDRRLDREPKAEELVGRANIDRRAEQMGEGVVVESHDIERGEDGSIEARTVYRIPDIEDLRLVNPYLAHDRVGRVMRIRFSPMYERRSGWHRVGHLAMSLVTAEEAPPLPEGIEEAPPASTPAELQTLRDLRPVFADLLSDSEVTIRITYPDDSEHDGTGTIVLFSFKGDDLDAHGRHFLENEEVMLRIMQLDFEAGIIRNHIHGGRRRPTGPTFRGRWYASGRFVIPPTEHLFDKYFKGRPRSQGGDRPD